VQYYHSPTAPARRDGQTTVLNSAIEDDSEVGIYRVCINLHDSCTVRTISLSMHVHGYLDSEMMCLICNL